MPPEFEDLPEETQKFLRDLRGEDVELLAASINFMRSLQTVSRFVKWCVILAAGSFMGVVALAESIGKVKAWWFAK